MTGPTSASGTWYRQPTGGRMLAGCPGTGTRIHPIPGGRLSIQQGAGPAARGRPSWGQEEALDMDVENVLAKASENLSVRRAFGTAYEKDGMLIIAVALVAGGGAGGTGTARTRSGDSAARPGGVACRGRARGARRSIAGLRAHGRRRGLRRAGAAVRRLRRQGRPGPLGTRGGRDDRRPGLAEPGAGARPHLDPPAQAPQSAMTLNSRHVRRRQRCAAAGSGTRQLQREAPTASS